MANRISTILDLDGNSFGRAVDNIKARMAAADTLTGKLREGWRGAVDEFNKSGVAQAAAAGIAVAVAKQAIDSASALEESVNAVNVSYGAAGESVLKLGDDSVEAFGLSERAFNTFAVQFSGFAKQIAAKEGRAVSDVLKDLATRAADFASVMDLDLNTATQVFMSTLAGETEPIRRFGKDVSAAAVSQHLLATGVVESTSEITEADKVLGRYQVLMKSTADTAGDFANTGDTLANSSRKLSGNIENLQAKLGKGLMPTVASTVSGINDLVEQIEELKTALDQIPGSAHAFDVLGKALNYPGLMIKAISLQMKPLAAGADLAVEGVKKLGGWLGIGGNEAEKAAVKLNIFEKAVADATDTEGIFAQTVEDAIEAARAEGTATDESVQAHDVAAKMLERHTEAVGLHEDALIDVERANELFVAGIEAAVEKQIETTEKSATAASEWRDNVNGSFSSAAEGFGEFTDDVFDDAESFREALNKQSAAVAEWQTNLTTIASDTSAEFATYLASLGPAAATMVSDLAENTDELQLTFDTWKLNAGITTRDMAAEFGILSPEVSAILNALPQGVSPAWDNIRKWFAAAGASAGSAAARGVASGITANIQASVDAMFGLADQVVAAGRQRLNIHSPSQVMAEEVGRPIVEGIAAGIEESAEEVEDALVDALENAEDAAVDAAQAVADAVGDRLESAWDDVNNRLGEADMRERISDAERRLAGDRANLAEVQADPEASADDIEDAAERVSDSEESLRDANRRLFTELVERGRVFEARALAGSVDTGLTPDEVVRILGEAIAFANASSALDAAKAGEWNPAQVAFLTSSIADAIRGAFPSAVNLTIDGQQLAAWLSANFGSALAAGVRG